jgi:hypothetical protein
MDEFEKFAAQVNELDINKILFEVWKNFKVREFIIKLNTEGLPTSQLFNKGEDSLGVSLGDYSPFTKQIKAEKGQRLDHITLKDTGDFYETFFVTPFLKGFSINADGNKGGGDNLFDDFGQDITGLNEENKIILCEFIRPFFIAEAAKVLSQIS